MATREAELFKEKIEVSLDGRQIFCLFCGGAVIACLVFVLGVMVGRRVEARVHPEHLGAKAAASDPLAALDQLAATDLAGGDLAFRETLRGEGEDPRAPVDVAIESAMAEAAAAQAADESAQAEGKNTAAPGDKADKPAGQPAAKPEAVAKAEPEPKPEPAAAVAEPKPETAAKPESDARFTLQLSSFQDKAEADAFSAKLAKSGFSPYLVKADVPDKGTFFRVRVGKYPDYDAALAAKAEFEKKQQIIAYVTRL